VTLPNGTGLYPDYMKPNKSAEFHFNELYLSLAVKPRQTVKAEVAVDGKIHDNIVVDNFENVTLDLDSDITRPKKITVHACDHFLNRTEKTATMRSNLVF
jgi:hypothetical protein